MRQKWHRADLPFPFAAFTTASRHVVQSIWPQGAPTAARPAISSKQIAHSVASPSYRVSTIVGSFEFGSFSIAPACNVCNVTSKLDWLVLNRARAAQRSQSSFDSTAQVETDDIEQLFSDRWSRGKTSRCDLASSERVWSEGLGKRSSKRDWVGDKPLFSRRRSRVSATCRWLIAGQSFLSGRCGVITSSSKALDRCCDVLLSDSMNLVKNSIMPGVESIIGILGSFGPTLCHEGGKSINASTPSFLRRSRMTSLIIACFSLATEARPPVNPIDNKSDLN